MWLVITKVRSEIFELVTECHLYNGRHLLSAVITTHIIFFIVECGIVRFLCAMHVLEVRASSSPRSLPLCQILFLSQPPLLSWPMEKNYILNQSLTQSINHTPSLFDVPGTEAFASEMFFFYKLSKTTMLNSENVYTTIFFGTSKIRSKTWLN